MLPSSHRFPCIYFNSYLDYHDYLTYPCDCRWILRKWRAMASTSSQQACTCERRNPPSLFFLLCRNCLHLFKNCFGEGGREGRKGVLWGAFVAFIVPYFFQEERREEGKRRGPPLPLRYALHISLKQFWEGREGRKAEFSSSI